MKIVVLGGGAAGFFAAIHAAQNNDEVIILEKTGNLLAKVRISGGGRCNVTNAMTEPVQVAACFPRGNKELVGPLSRFGTQQTMDWFRDQGVFLKTEPDGRIFPQSNSSKTIIDCLMNAAKISGVRISTHTPVKTIKFSDGNFQLLTGAGDIILSDKVIVATGGSPSTGNYEWLRQLGHTIEEPVPSLFTFNIPESPFRDLMGVSVQDCIVKIEGTKMQQRGPLLFTHWGISGPAVLRLSAWAARLLKEKNYDFNIIINFLPELNNDRLSEQFKTWNREVNPGNIFNTSFNSIPSRLWKQLCLLAGAKPGLRWIEAGNKFQNKLCELIQACSLHVKGKTTFKEEFVTCGGVVLKEVNMKTMESKKIPGLYFAGEVLDIDGITGGFNFQAAWTTGYIAGISASGANENA